MTAINLVFVSKKSLRTHSVVVTTKSEAQSLVDLLDKKQVQDIRISFIWDGAEQVVYTTHGKTYQLIKV